MSWLNDVVGGISRVTKLANNLELQLKSQDEEIKLLRRDNADLRKEMSDMAQRLARLEEARKTTAAEVKVALTETIAEYELRKLREENEALKRKQVSSTD